MQEAEGRHGGDRRQARVLGQAFPEFDDRTDPWVLCQARVELRLIGRNVPRRDIPAKTDGSAVFGIDFRVPGMAYAAVRQAPAFGGSVMRFDGASIAKRPGVIGAFAIPNGVGVVAEHFVEVAEPKKQQGLRRQGAPDAVVLLHHRGQGFRHWAGW